MSRLTLASWRASGRVSERGVGPGVARLEVITYSDGSEVCHHGPDEDYPGGAYQVLVGGREFLTASRSRAEQWLWDNHVRGEG